MKYVSDAGKTLKDSPVSTSAAVVGAVAATLVTMRNVKMDSPVLQGLAVAGAALTGFAATYGGALLTDRAVSYARSCSFFKPKDDATGLQLSSSAGNRRQ